MRSESSTVVALVGDVAGELLTAAARSPNVSVARPQNNNGSGQDAGAPAALRPGLETAATMLREAARRRSMYVIVPADPLAEVAAFWRQMWDPAAGSPGSAAFESAAATALAAWRAKQFELPDYYLVMAPAQGGVTAPDLYLGPLRAVRPRRVAVAIVGETAAGAGSLLDALRSLEHGPWWPPLDELIAVARGFYAGGLAESQQLAT
jgi:hypothetical protein